MALSGEYQGNLRVDCLNDATGAKQIVDTKFENFGQMTTYTPLDLLALSLATCALLTIAIYCNQRGIDIEGARFEADKTMATNPNRVAKINVTFIFPPKGYDQKERAGVERALRSCPARNSLSAEMEQDIKFRWLDDEK